MPGTCSKPAKKSGLPEVGAKNAKNMPEFGLKIAFFSRK
jgi:hypothetical protein